MSKKILLADDSVTIQKVVGITLAHEDFDLVVVDNGAKAVAKAREIRPDVILLDVMMPDKDGYQVCREIKETAELSGTPIILLTGTFEPFDADRAAEVGADDFIKKPFESHTLINKVKEMAAKRGVARERPVDISGLDIGFETPREGEHGREARGERITEEVDLETPWEEEVVGEKRPAAKGKEAEDIWSVEEFEDIAGTRPAAKGGAARAERPAPVEDMWGEDRLPTRGAAKEKAAPPKGISDEFFVEEGTPRDGGGEGFELGEEISEDELEKFLEEEGTEVGMTAGGRTGEAEDLLAEESDEGILDLDEGKGLRTKGEEIGGIDEKEFGEDTDLDEPIDIEWEEGPEPDRGKAPAAAKTAREFEGVIRRTSEEELADFTEYRDEFGESEERPKTKEFELDTDSLEGRGSKEFTFEEVAEEEVGSRGPARDTGAQQRGGPSLGQKDLSPAVDKIAREVIEKVVWEVVPELAEELIKQEIKRLKGEKA